MAIIANEVFIRNGRLRQIGSSFRVSAKKQPRQAVFLCDCGAKIITCKTHVKTGHTLSCGCLKNEMIGNRSSTHGRTKAREFPRTYQAWCSMRRRCTNQKSKHWHNYGGRGITFDVRWNDYQCFEADMGQAPDGMTLERIDNNGNYGPDNCRWATRSEQMLNTRSNRLLSFNGKTQCLTSWAKELGIKAGTMRSRLRYGWSIERICTETVRQWPNAR